MRYEDFIDPDAHPETEQEKAVEYVRMLARMSLRPALPFWIAWLPRNFRISVLARLYERLMAKYRLQAGLDGPVTRRQWEETQLRLKPTVCYAKKACKIDVICPFYAICMRNIAEYPPNTH